MVRLRSPSVYGSAFVLWLFLTLSVGGKPDIKKGSMGSKGFCNKVKGKTQWLSDKGSALIIGKSGNIMPSVCTIVFGAATAPDKDVRLRLYFDFIYFDSCDVKLQINQSSTSDFENSKDNREMFMSGCNRQNPGPLYAQPKHYVLLSLKTDDTDLHGFNFRLNVSMAEHLPVAGIPLRVVIIVSFVCFLVVVSTAFVLIKYANRMSMEWSEEHREETIDRAINIYNSQESPVEEATMACMGVGVRSNGHNSHATRRANRPELAFIHGDGRVERFQPLVNQEEETSNSERLNRSKSPQIDGTNGRGGSPGEEPTHFYLSFSQDRPHSSHPQEQVSLISSEPTCSGMAEASETVSIGGQELPPSYEEALCMPLPSSVSDGGGFGDGGAHSNNGENTNVDNASPDTDLINLEDESMNYMNIQGNLQLLDAAAGGGREEDVETKESVDVDS